MKCAHLDRRGIVDIDSIIKIANNGIGHVKGYKNKLKGEEDKVLAEWLIKKSKEV